MSVEQSLAGDAEKHVSKENWITKLGRYCDDVTIMRTAFYGLAVGVVITLGLDYRAMLEADKLAPVITPRTTNPILPAFTPPTEGEETPQTVTPEITTAPEQLNNPMQIELTSNGILSLEGFISIGTAERFEAKVADISEYVKTVELNSPGGSVFDAIAMSTKIRELGWTTKISSGHLCASSCPLIFVGGKKRIVEEKAAIGVHQFFAASKDTRTSANIISGTQRTTAKITKHLEAMDVDPALWLHALETPPQQLYYFSRDELKQYKLITK